jgi:uncharacterized protein (TIGR03000 family)
MSMKKNLFAALVVGCALAVSANSASAHLFGHGGGCGSSGGGWGSHGGSWGGSYGSGGSYGGYSSCGSWGGGSGGSCGGWSCGSSGGGYAYYGGSYDGGYAVSRSSATIVASSPAVKTSLTIRVPADAKITLAGVDTKQTGETRQFATTRLAAGQSWDGYKVVVEMNKNGQTLHEERTLKLVGGEAQDLSINFDSTNVAKN